MLCVVSKYGVTWHTDWLTLSMLMARDVLATSTQEQRNALFHLRMEQAHASKHPLSLVIHVHSHRSKFKRWGPFRPAAAYMDAEIGNLYVHVLIRLILSRIHLAGLVGICLQVGVSL